MATSAIGNGLHSLHRTLISQNEAALSDSDLLERFVDAHDESAFEAILRRHGPMVLAVGRRILHNDADVDDVFQATFLVLVRKASSIRPRGMVGNWLYGVASTSAQKAKAMAAKRVTKEREAAARQRRDDRSENMEQLHSILDEELKQLPVLYRAAIVLCDLEGRSIKEAAREMGCPTGTIGPRLARGRRLLAKRLARRGISLPTGMLAALLWPSAATAAPPLLLHSTIQTLKVSAMGQAPWDGAVSSKVAALAEGVIKTMFLNKLKLLSGALAMTAIVAISAVVSQLPRADAQESPKNNTEPQAIGPSSAIAPDQFVRAALQQDAGKKERSLAIASALVWIAGQQKDNGSWEFDGAAAIADRVAATGMGVLPFLGAGITHKSDVIHREVVDKGLQFLLSEQKKTGRFGEKTMYSHAIATLAVCEAYSMTSDANLKARAQKAIDFIVTAQAVDGSWGYDPATQGDTSILGWQIQALRSAQLAGLTVPKECFTKAGKFLDSVASNGGSQYGYRGVQPSNSMSASGLLSRILIGTPPDKDILSKGLDNLWAKARPDEKRLDTYYLLIATQLHHQVGGDAWQKNWNPAVRETFLNLQVTPKTKGAKADEIGSWPKDMATIGNGCGRLGTTCLSTLILEVAEPRLPLFKTNKDVSLNARGGERLDRHVNLARPFSP